MWLLVFLSALSPVAINMMLPSLATIAVELNTSIKNTQTAITVYILGVALGQLVYGPLSDRYGRRPLILLGGIVFTVANIAVALSTGITELLILRALQAVGGCSGMVLTRAMVRDCYPENRAASALGYITVAMVVAPASAPLIGGIIDEAASWRYGFGLLSLLGLGQIIIARFLLPETNLHRVTGPLFGSLARGFRSLLGYRAFLAYMACNTLVISAFFAFLVAGPYAVTVAFGMTPTDYGLYSLVMAVGYTLGNWIAGRFGERMGGTSMMRLGTVIYAITAIGMALLWAIFEHSVLLLFIPISVSSIGTGLALPGIMAGALSINPRLAGSASALMGTIPMLGGAALTELTGRLLTPDLWAFMILYTSSGCLALLFAEIGIRLRRHEAVPLRD